MTTYRKEIGKFGEDIAVNHLQDLGYIIIQRNFTTHWGEIDVIAKKNNTIYFVEVKTKVGDKKGKPYESVTYRKIQNLKRSINLYLLKNDYKKYKLSLSVVSVELDENKAVKELKFFDQVGY